MREEADLLDDVADPAAQGDRVDPGDVRAVDEIRPWVGSMSRLTIIIVVVLPQPGTGTRKNKSTAKFIMISRHARKKTS